MRYCSKCGKKLTDDQIYCPRCGNKEPLIKNNKKSSWKDFEPQTKAKNVNYDFTNVEIAKSNKTNPALIKNKPLLVLGRIYRIYSIVVGIYFIVFSLILTFTNVAKGSNVGDILNILAISLAGVQLITTIVMVSITVATKNSNPLIKNMFVSIITLSVMSTGFIIGQYFTYKHIQMAMFGVFTGAMTIMSNAIVAKLYPFKKTA